MSEPKESVISLERDVFIALAAVAWADGEVAPEEATALLRAAEACGVEGDDLAQVMRSAEHRVDLSDLGELQLSLDAKLFVYALATWMAQSDGVVVDAERATLEELGGRLALSQRDMALATATRLDPAATTADLHHLAEVIEADAKRESAGASDDPLPQGSTGWPVIGETPSFIRDGFGFVEERTTKFGNVFRTRLFGRDVAVISGPRAAVLWTDESCVVREGASFEHVLSLMGGANLASLDGAAHRARKRQVLAAFSESALEGYLPGLEHRIHEAFDTWADADEIQLSDPLKSLVMASIADSMLSLHDPASIEGIALDYRKVSEGLLALPWALPGSTMRSARQARDRLLQFMRDCVAESRETPGSDGVSRLLEVESASGEGITDEDAALELHHLFVAGRVLFAVVAGLLWHLGRDETLREAVAVEVREHAEEGAVTPGVLSRMKLLHRVVQEVKRVTPIFPLVFARARRPITFEGATIPEGWQVGLALHRHHMLESVFPEPSRFDPARFEDARFEGDRVEQEPTFAPHGPGPDTGHKCPGADYSTRFLMLFTVLLLRDYTWEVVADELRYDWGHAPPELHDGLRVRITRLHVTSAPR